MKKRAAALAAGCAALAVVAGTWAYYSNTASIDNQLETKHYGDSLVEKFTPNPDDDDDWEPGEKVDKIVNVVNTGASEIVVRVKLEELWTYKDGELPFKDIESKDGTKFTTTSQASATDGLTEADDTVVAKDINTTDWTYGGDGYWYYKAILPAETTTADFMKSLTLLSEVDEGLFVKKSYYTTNETVSATEPSTDNIGTDSDEGWVEFDPVEKKINDDLATELGKDIWTKSISYVDPEKKGYSDAQYDLIITSETCQATKAAVDATWTGVNATKLACYGDLK